MEALGYSAYSGVLIEVPEENDDKGSENVIAVARQWLSDHELPTDAIREDEMVTLAYFDDKAGFVSPDYGGRRVAVVGLKKAFYDDHPESISII